MEETKEINNQLKSLNKTLTVISVVFAVIFMCNTVIMYITYHPFLLTIATVLSAGIAYASCFFVVKWAYKDFTEKTIETRTQIYLSMKKVTVAFLTTVFYVLSYVLINCKENVLNGNLVFILVFLVMGLFEAIMVTILTNIFVGHILNHKQIIEAPKNIPVMTLNMIFLIISMMATFTLGIEYYNSLINTDSWAGLGTAILLILIMVVVFVGTFGYILIRSIIYAIQKSNKARKHN